MTGVALSGEGKETADLKRKVDELTRRVASMEKQERLFQGGESWTDRFSIYGDFRYRHEYINWETDPDEDDHQRNRHRIRLRVGIKANVNEEVVFEMRTVTGGTSETATNQDLDLEFQTKSWDLDRANVKYKPEALKIVNFEAIIGKFGNPFFRPGNEQLLWDTDLAFEGGAIKTSFDIDPVNVFLNAGGFWVEENPFDADNGLWGVQGGVKFPVLDTGVTVVTGCSGFWFTPSKHEGPFGGADGNSIDPVTGGYEYEFNLFEAFGEVHFKLYEIPIVVFGDFVENTNAPNENTGYLFGLRVGTLKKQWDWRFQYDYRDLEQDATVGNFSDADPGGGGTNIRGHEINFSLRIMKNVDFGINYWVNDVDEEGIDPIGERTLDYDKLQVDLMFRF
jgi:hypothetical protein